MNIVVVTTSCEMVRQEDEMVTFFQKEEAGIKSVESKSLTEEKSGGEKLREYF